MLRMWMFLLLQPLDVVQLCYSKAGLGEGVELRIMWRVLLTDRHHFYLVIFIMGMFVLTPYFL